jgi:hypothetical protein
LLSAAQRRKELQACLSRHSAADYRHYERGFFTVKAHVIGIFGALAAFGFTMLAGWYDGVDYFLRGRVQASWTGQAALTASCAYLFIRGSSLPLSLRLGHAGRDSFPPRLRSFL